MLWRRAFQPAAVARENIIARHRLRGQSRAGASASSPRNAHTLQAHLPQLIFQSLRQLGVDAYAYITYIVGMGIVHQVLEAEGASHWQVIAGGEFTDVLTCSLVPAAATQQQYRAL